MKKILLGFSALIVIAALILACGTSGRVRTTMNPGTYTATVRGYGGIFDVSVEVSNNAILGINIGQHFETGGIYEVAFERIPEQIIRYQSLAVDRVAGATVSSMALLQAVSQAVELAGGDPAAFFANRVPPRRARRAVEMRPMSSSLVPAAPEW